MYSNELFKTGVYGIKDTEKNKIVYIGSTNTSFIRRWGNHSEDYMRNEHCNQSLVKLFDTGNFEFVILEITDCNTRELLEKEQYYITLYDVFKNGYNQNVGGGNLLKAEPYTRPMFEVCNPVIAARDYIINNWFDRRIYAEDIPVITDYLFKNYGISTGQFMLTIHKLGFIIQRYASKRSFLITGKVF